MNSSHFDKIINSFNFKKSSYGLLHTESGIKFIEIDMREALPSVMKLIEAFGLVKNVGIYCNSLTERDKDKLKKSQISYIAGIDEVKIFRPSSEKDHIERALFSPIAFLISPTGLEIVDTIFKSRISELDSMNPTDFCQKYELSRSKMSQVMKSYSCRNLTVLAKKLREISLDEWLEGMKKATTSRSMTAFRTKKSRIYVFSKEIDDFDFFDCVSNLKRKQAQIEYGGLSYLKIQGAIKARDFDLLAEDKDIRKILNSFDLRPPKRDDSFKRRLIVTPCVQGLRRERLENRIPNSASWNNQLSRLNVLRYVWGIREKESRIQEERVSLLRRYLNEVKSTNN